MNPGPQLAFSDNLHRTKYRQEGEDFRESVNRWSSATSDGGDHYHELREICLDMRFMPAGRQQAAMGSTKEVTAYNCFVSGPVEDSFVDGHGSIMARAMEAARTMRMGGGIGYNFSALRPRGALIRKLGSNSTGPVSFMRIFNEVGLATSSSGHRRGAQMGVLNIDHPDIVEFVHAKNVAGALTGFNVSIGVTDEFMEALAAGRPFALRWGGETHREIDPAELWEQVMRSTWDHAEPGVLFIDTINRMNNLWYCERIDATNPCAEQPLPPYGACLLGSLNLTRYLRPQNAEGGETQEWYLDNDQIAADIPVIVRAVDNVIDRARYPLHEQEQEAQSKRRMGIGVTGVANAIEALWGGPCYGDPVFCNILSETLELIERECYRASALLAAEKGSFPLYDAEKYLGGQHVQRLDDDTLGLIRRHGIRNSHLTSIAPTGTISLCADNCSSGIEPVFAFEAEREVHLPEGQVTETVRDFGLARFGVTGRPARDVTVRQHMDVLATAYDHVDSAVSKTMVVPSDTPWDEFKGVYVEAHARGCKGFTTFQDGGKREGVIKSRDAEACTFDAETGGRTCDA